MDIEEAIEYLKESVCIYKNIIPKISQAIETVLNELEYKQDDINVLQAQRDSVENQLKQAKAELEKKDEIIDLMAKTLKGVKSGSKYCGAFKIAPCNKDKTYPCDKCIKQYFTRTVDKQSTNEK